MTDDVRALWETDAGDDDSIKASEVDEFKAKDGEESKICFIFPKHFKAYLHSFQTADGGFRSAYCVAERDKKTGRITKPGFCCNLLDDPPDVVWFNMIWNYGQGSGVGDDFRGSVQFIKMKRGKYIDFRNKLFKVREDLEDDDIPINAIDFDVALDGEQKFQKFKLTHNMRSSLVQKATSHVLKALCTGEISDKHKERHSEWVKQVTTIIGTDDPGIDDLKSAFESKQGKKQLLSPTIAAPFQLLKVYSPLFKEIVDDAEGQLDRLANYHRFARHYKTEDELKNQIVSAGKGGDQAPDLTDVEEQELDKLKDDMNL